MNVPSAKAVKAILAAYGIRPSRGLGQNFLIDRHAAQKLMAAADIQPEDTVLEIGPGIGALTQELARRAKRVVAIEKDRGMVEILKETLHDFRNIDIIPGDILKVNLSHIPTLPHSYKVAANLPYYITAPILRKFLELCEAKPNTMSLIVHKEVAQRICAKPPDMNILAVSVQIYAAPKITAYTKKTAFWPQPKVDAAILRIVPLSTPYPLDFPKFFTVVKAGFKQPRKQLVNNLSSCLKFSREKTEQWLLQNNIHPTQRAETLSIQDWINLTNTV